MRKRSAAILQFMLFHSEGNKLSPLFISNYVTINVLDTLARVPGVGQALMFGNLDYSMRVWFDTDRLNSLGLVPSDVLAAVQSQNVQAAVGRVGAKPTSDATQFQLNLQTKGRLTTPEEFGNIIVRANPDGSVLRVRDVARVELGAATQDTESRLNGDPAVAVGRLPLAGRQCGGDLGAGVADARCAGAAVPAGPEASKSCTTARPS